MPKAKTGGLEYFPHFCKQPDSIKYLVCRHGLAGYVVYFGLLEKIYGGEGYFFLLNNKNNLLLSREFNLDSPETLFLIISTCVSEKIFDQNLFNRYSILTSEPIQRQYLEATKRRKQRFLKKEYLLIDLIKEGFKKITLESINDQ